ncbi:MAG TPA: hypothetical protein VJ583_06425 [Nitrososphaeraceae archaeon]|nr:hypothetical protein [Nitrososphaeraceae archaeon]
MTNAQAQPYYNDDGMHDNNNYYKSEKDNSKSVNINKIKCINSNLNINGINSGDVNIGNKGQVYLGADSYTGYYEGHGNNNKQGKNCDCVINNNNTNSDIVSTIPLEPEPTTARLKVTKQLTCDDSNAREGDCEQLLELITEDQFTFRVEATIQFRHLHFLVQLPEQILHWVQVIMQY